MAVTDPNSIDLVRIERSSGKVLLIISDHLPWDDVDSHLQSLQDKINSYFTFIESGELTERFPIATDRRPVIVVALKHDLPDSAEYFFVAVEETATTAGVEFRTRLVSD